MFTEKAKVVEKRWGREIWFANDEDKDYCGKILEIDPNSQLSLHFHLIKQEHLFNMEGDCKVHYLSRGADIITFDLAVGHSFLVKPGLVHRFSTEHGCRLLEASTFHRDSDSYKVAK
ncbi:MAG: hypothetical protein NWE83_07460 [Candidatus Bathyarchaeota archaeon]|nr:hypothetical protein [Candidatus Bathyarchaeota archaeon]